MTKRARLVILEPGAVEHRFRAIDETLLRYAALTPVSILFEGVLPSLWQPAEITEQDESDRPLQKVVVHNLGFGCPCCIGSLPLTVTLTRALRQEKPQLIILAPLPGAHLATLGQFLIDKFSSHLELAAS